MSQSNSFREAKTIPCPECGFPIPVNMMQLLMGQPHKCLNVNCQIELNIDTSQSKKGIEALKNFDHSIQEFENAKKNISY
ncbi:MAG: hypothetical protein HOO91_16840 [Bacteroidales bacterium]|nr:hypothetical protein [Bacteroidales bacterium]